MEIMIGNMPNSGIILHLSRLLPITFFAELLCFRFTINDKQKNRAIIQLIIPISTIPLFRDITN